MATFQAIILLRFSLLRSFAHARLLPWISSRETRFRRGGDWESTSATIHLERRTRWRTCGRRSALRRAYYSEEPGVDERLPVIRVDEDVGELAASARNGDRRLRLWLRSQSPFLAVGFAGAAPVGVQRLAACGYTHALREHRRRTAWLVLDGLDCAALAALVHNIIPGKSLWSGNCRCDTL